MNPQLVSTANQVGYLIAPYAFYHSIKQKADISWQRSSLTLLYMRMKRPHVRTELKPWLRRKSRITCDVVKLQTDVIGVTGKHTKSERMRIG
ncbi:hypothetical protein [Paenibacillus sp. FSL H7-0331]|uniref:hypothetical protein n=1 Tax=Paenibacillus sp. FSL H7-0331 TaxID=1920421 RepID=UPI00096EDF4F|nr:hypothetical protein BK127_31380 [Paenibacillus sp. FSL H7-0331]